MSSERTESTAERFARAISGRPGDPCVGVTFLPAEAIGSVSWGARRDEPLLSAVCSRLQPDFAFVNSWEPDAARLCVEVAECGTVPLLVVRGPFDSVATRVGWAEAIRLTVADPAHVASLMDEAADETLTLLDTFLSSAGVAAVVVADDVSGADGPLLAPDFIIGELFGRIGRIAEEIHRRDLPVIWHSDGDLRPFLASAARVGLEAVHPGGLDIESFGRLFSVAQDAGLCVLGGVPGEVLRSGGPAVVRAGITASLVARGGGLLVCDDGGVTTGEELGLLITALQVARAPEGERP